MKKITFANVFLFCCITFLLVSPVVADDDSTSFSIALGDSPYQWEHIDAEPFKGWANVTVTNTGTEAWGDFHFEFYDPIGGQDISNLAFLDASLGGSDPTSSQSPLSWSIDNDIVGATMDLYFYDDPVLLDQTATFSVYTDNTINQLPSFGLMMHATPVPEPATISLLTLGALALRRRRRQ